MLEEEVNEDILVLLENSIPAQLYLLGGFNTLNPLEVCFKCCWLFLLHV